VTRGVFHRARTVAPQRPLERPASDFVCVVAWPPPHRRSTPFHPRRPFRAFESQAPVHAPRCQREARFSEPRRSLPTSATVVSTRGHTRRAFDPRTRVGLSPRYSPAPTDAGCVGLAMRCRTADLRATFHTRRLFARRVPLAWTGWTVGRSARAKATGAFLDEFARALLVAPRAPVSPARLVARSGVPRSSSLRPRSPSDAAPRRVAPSKEPRCFLPRWNPYATRGLLLRARLDRSPVTPPPKGHCSGAHALFSPLLQRLPLTRKAPESTRPSGPWEPKPPLVWPVEAPNTASTTESVCVGT